MDSTVAATRPFARASDAVGVAQVASAALLGVAVVAAMRWLGPAAALLAPALAAVVVRLFVLQHDCGHRSLLSTGAANDRVGTAISVVLGMPYEAWRAEHAWHHAHQGRLSSRGIDRVNSPPTVAEGRADPEAARRRARLIRPAMVFLLGALSLLLTRKTIKGFFPFRPGFRWKVPGRERLPRSIVATVVVHLGFQLALGALIGPAAWLTGVAPAWVLASGVGGTLFFLQHNFERAWYADDAAWDPQAVALRGSSYLRLPSLFARITGHIGLHHVHHLNPRIPNYRLEAARRSIPALAAVAPLGIDDVRRCYTHIFWDAEQQRMVPLDRLEAR